MIFTESENQFKILILLIFFVSFAALVVKNASVPSNIAESHWVISP